MYKMFRSIQAKKYTNTGDKRQKTEDKRHRQKTKDRIHRR